MNYQEQGAFPCHAQFDSLGNAVIYAEQGMTLRDYFAASVVGHMFSSGIHAEKHNTFESAIKHMAEDAYEIADSMMAARNN